MRAGTLPAQMSFRDVLRIDVMRRVWYAQAVSLFGDFLALFAVLAVEPTGDAVTSLLASLR